MRLALRRGRARLARIVLRSPLGFALRRASAVLLIAALPAAGIAYGVTHPQPVAGALARASDAAAGWAGAGWRLMVGQLSLSLDVDAARGLLQSVLPSPAAPASGPEPPDSWRTPLRAWVHVATGYDFANPRSFLEAEAPGFRAAVLRSMDVVRVPAGGASEGVAQTPGRPGDGEGRAAGVPGGEVALGPAGGSQAPQGGSALQGDRGVGERAAGDLPAAPPGSEITAEGAQLPPQGPQAPPEEAARPPAGPRLEPAREERALPSGIPASLASLPLEPWGRAPLVLIVHSHTSESYRTIPPDPRANAQHHIYNSSDTGIVRVGRALAQKLQEEYNIPSIHSTRVHNWPHHARAYLNSRETVQEILRENPTIKVVLDIHRQGVPGYTYATTVDGIEAVGVDIIYTTGLRASYSNPHWQSNEAFANQLAEAMAATHPGLLRRVMRIDDSVYNQDLHPRMLLLEIGNYLDLEEHAIAAAKLLADSVALALAQVVAEERGREDFAALGRVVVPRRAPPPIPLLRPEG